MHVATVECPSCRQVLPAAMKFCGYCGAALPQAREEPEEDRRIVSVLFCDLVGFTPLSERLDAEDVREIQDAYFGRMSAEIERFGGRVEKYAGDAVLAVFGAPTVHEDDAERAVRCALAMHEALLPLARNTRVRHGVELALRIGVNTGEVVSGVREGAGRHDYAVTGDVVNTAARYQAVAEPGGIMVGTETRRLAERSIRFGGRRDLTLKGKSEPVPGYPVLGVRSRAERWEPLWRTPLVGRERELQEIDARWRNMRDGGQIVMIEAEAGIGKSRLLTEALARIGGSGNVSIVRAQCRRYGQEISLSLMADVLKDLCGVTDEDSPSQVRETLVRSVGALPGGTEASRAVTVDVLGELLGLPVGEPMLTQMGPDVRRDVLIEGIDGLLAAAAHVPAVLVLEDVHWADSASLEILAVLLRRAMARTMLVIYTRRPEGEIALPDGALILRLDPLQGAEAIQLARSILGRDLSRDLERHLEARAGGNPLFVEELVRALEEAGDLEEREGVMYLLPGAAERLPSTLTEILLARFDRLERSVRSLTQVGSVIGRSFALRLLAATVDDEESLLEPRLEPLQRAALAFKHWTQELEYVFKHALVREVVYGTLLMRRRREIHERVARALIELYPADDMIEVIAYHFAQTDSAAAAAAWLERAGDRAAAMYANEAATTHYEGAREHLARSGGSAAALAALDEKLGQSLFILARYDDAVAVLGRAEAHYAEMDGAEGLGRVVAATALIREAQGVPGQGLDILAAFLDAHGDTELQCLGSVHRAHARLLTRTGRYEEALSAAVGAVKHARRTRNQALLVEAAIEQAVALSMVSRLAEAAAVMEDVLPVAEQSNDLATAFRATLHLGGTYEDLGQIRECLAHFERGLEMARQLGRPVWIASSLLNLGRIHYRHGDWDRSDAEMREALDIYRRIGASSSLPAALYALGALSAFRGRWEEHEQAMDEARSRAEAMGDVALVRWIEGFTAQGDILRGRPEVGRDRLVPLRDRGDVEESEVTWFLPVLAWAHLEAGDTDQARSTAADVLRRSRESRNQVALADALWVAGKIATRDRRWEDARALFEEGIALNRETSFYWAEIRTRFEYGLMLLAAGETERGREMVEHSLGAFRDLGTAPYIWRAEQALANI